MGNARFTLPASSVATRPVMAPSTAGIGKNLFRATRQQANIVTTLPKFEVPKFESTSLVTRMDMGTNLAQTEFNDPGNLELASVNLGDAKQSFKNAFLKAVREPNQTGATVPTPCPEFRRRFEHNTCGSRYSKTARFGIRLSQTLPAQRHWITRRSPLSKMRCRIHPSLKGRRGTVCGLNFRSFLS